MTVKVIKGVKLGGLGDLTLSWIFMMIVTFVMILLLPNFDLLIVNKIALFLIILAESIAIGIFALFSIFSLIYRRFEFFIVSSTYKNQIPPESAEENFKWFIEQIRISISNECNVTHVNRFDNLDPWFSTRESNILMCEKKFVIYLDSSLYNKKTLKIGIGFRPLHKDITFRNKIIQNIETLAKQLEPIE
jgi:hypothetical protein